MMPQVDYLELFLYIFPIAEIFLIHRFFRPYLSYQNYFKLSVTDAVIPMLLAGIHILSVRLLTYSLLPHFLFALFLLGFLMTVYFHWKNKNASSRRIFSVFLKVVFSFGFVFYYGLAAVRLFRLLKG